MLRCGMRRRTAIGPQRCGRRVHGACDRVLAYSGSGVGTLLLAVELDRRLSLQLLKLAAHLQPGSAREYSRVLT